MLVVQASAARRQRSGSGGRVARATGDVAYVLTSFMLVNGYLRDVGQHIREAQHAVNDLEDIVEYDLTEPDVQDRSEADGSLDVREW